MSKLSTLIITTLTLLLTLNLPWLVFTQQTVEETFFETEFELETVAVTTQFYVAIDNFDITQISGIDYHVVIFFKNIVQPLYACDAYRFTAPTDATPTNGSIYYQVGLRPGGPDVPYDIITGILEPTLDSAGEFLITTGYFGPGSFYFLDRASDYEWMILAVESETEHFIAVVSKGQQDMAALRRGLKVAEQYGFEGGNLVLQQDCDYSEAFAAWAADLAM